MHTQGRAQRGRRGVEGGQQGHPRLWTWGTVEPG